MHARLSIAAVTLGALTASASFSSEAATQYGSVQMPSSARTHVAINDAARVLSMRLDTPQERHIVIENWSNGGRNYAEFRPEGPAGGPRKTVAAFNESQQITGFFDAPVRRAFVYRDGVFTDLSTLAPIASSSTDFSAGAGINDRGDVVGSWHDASRVHAFLYRNGVVTDLGALADIPLGTTRANAINNNGQIVGASNVPGSSTSSNPALHAFLYENGALQDLGLLPGHDLTEATAINDAGEVVGIALMGNHTRSCFHWHDGTMVNMGLIDNVGPGPRCDARAINNSGVAVGRANALPTPTDSAISAAFVYQDGAMTDLNTLIDPSDPLARGHVRLHDAISINDRGEILAASIVNGVTTYYLLQPDGLAPADPAHYSFEGTSQGWHSTGEPIVTVSPTTAQKFAGEVSLGVTFNSGGFASVSVDVPPAQAGQLVTFRVFIPADATFDWIQPFVLEGLEGGWNWSGNWQPLDALQLGEWNTLTVQVPANAAPLWQMGVEFFSSEGYQGTAYIDSVDF